MGEENLPRRATEVLQLNVGLYCNQACSHCHVESSPKRTEVMSLEVAQRCIDILRKSPSIKSVDLTGTIEYSNPLKYTSLRAAEKVVHFKFVYIEIAYT